MARQSKLQENLGDIFSDLAKIAMSRTANRQSQQLQLETNLIELEMRNLSRRIETAQTEYKDKQEEFQETTGIAFNLNNEFKTPGFEKFTSSISEPILDGYINVINRDRQELATREAQIESITKLQQGPLSDITDFYEGTMTPTDYSGRPDIIDAEDMSDAALDAFLGDKYQDMPAEYLAGIKSGIKARTALAQIKAQKESVVLAGDIITANNALTVAEAQSETVDWDVLEGLNARQRKSTALLVDVNLPATYLEGFNAAKTYYNNASASLMESPSDSDAKALEIEAKTIWDKARYDLGNILTGSRLSSYEEYITSLDTFRAEDNQELVEIWEQELAETISIGQGFAKAVSDGVGAAGTSTSIPYAQQLEYLYTNFLSDAGDAADWDTIERITGLAKEDWENDIPRIIETNDATRAVVRKMADLAITMGSDLGDETITRKTPASTCLLYTSDAADE